MERRRFLALLPTLPALPMMLPSQDPIGWTETVGPARYRLECRLADGRSNAFLVWAESPGALTGAEITRAREMARTELGAWARRQGYESSA